MVIATAVVEVDGLKVVLKRVEAEPAEKKAAAEKAATEFEKAKTIVVAGNHSHLWDQDDPLLVRHGGVALHKEKTNARQHGEDYTDSFT